MTAFENGPGNVRGKESQSNESGEVGRGHSLAGGYIAEAGSLALDQRLPEHMSFDDKLGEAGIGFAISPPARRPVNNHLDA